MSLYCSSELMETRRDVLQKSGIVAALGTTGLAGCLGGDEEEGDDDTVTAAYVYDEPVADIGWTNTHEKTRKALEEEFDWYETQVVEDISPSEAASTFNDLANQGVDVIEAATFDYGEPAADVVQDHDDLFIETPRIVPVDTYDGDQLGYYLGRLEDACYVAGKAAGMLTETNLLGYVMPFDIASTVTELNALMLGARSVNEDAELIIRRTNSWYDPPAEQDAAESLVEEGADVLGYRVSSPTTMEVAEENDLWSYGYADSFSGTDIEYDKYITSRMWDWTPFYRQTAEAARDGELGDSSRFSLDELRGNYFGIPEGGVTLDDYGSGVPSEVVDEMDSTIEAIESGEITSQDMFEGSMYSDMSQFERVTTSEEYVEGVLD